MRKKRLKKRLKTKVKFYHPLGHSKAPSCLVETAAFLNGQTMPLQNALDIVKEQFSQIPVGEGEVASVGYYAELKGRHFHRWTKRGWIVVIVKEDGTRRRGWEIVKFRRLPN